MCACGSQVASADKICNTFLLTTTNEYIEREFVRIFIESVRVMGWGGVPELYVQLVQRKRKYSLNRSVAIFKCFSRYGRYRII